MSGYILHVFSFVHLIGISLGNANNEYCVADNFNPTCKPNEVIIMTEAKYGQMNLGRCIEDARGDLGCHGDVLEIFDKLCSGRQSCDVRVGSNNMADKSTCWKSLLQYLEATYICRKELQVTDQQCGTTTLIQLTEHETIITSDIAERGQQNCIRLNQPVVVSAKRGQVLNITLLDFYHSTEPEHNSLSYGKIRDFGDGNDITITVGHRKQHLKITSGHNMEITFYSNAQRFALDIKVMGCADLSPPVGAWMTRDGDVTELGCHSGKHTWTLQCVDDQWVGAVGYCGSVSGEQFITEQEVAVDNAGISANISVFGVCSLLLLLSSIIFLAGVLILRRHNRMKRSEYIYHPAVPITVSGNKDLMTFDRASLHQHNSLQGSMIGTLPVDGRRMVTSQDYKSLQI